MKLTRNIFTNKNNQQISLTLPKKILLEKLKIDKFPDKFKIPFEIDIKKLRGEIKNGNS